MDETINVDLINCEAVAQRIVESLQHKTFKIVSAYVNEPPKHELPRVLDGLILSGGYLLKDGSLTIKLLPYRRIFWDVQVEKVSVTFLNSNNIILERVLPFLVKKNPPGSRTIDRVITICF